MSTCSTSYGQDQTFTSLYTNTQTSYYTNYGSDVVTSTPVVSTACATPTCSGNSTSCGTPVCSTTTSFQLQTITGGAASTGSYTVTSVATVLSTSYGSASTICSSTSSSSSSDQSSYSQYTPPASTSSTRQTTAPTQAPAAASSNPLTSTSFSTVFVTSVDTNGRTSVIPIPTLLNSGNAANTGGSKSNAGAIGGGVVGGVVALLAAIGFLWFLKRKGVFSKDGDEHFGDDIWRPSAHSPDGGDHDGARGSADDSGVMMSEKDAGSVGHMGGTHQSWYGGDVDRATTPGAVDGYVDTTSADGHQVPPAAYRDSRMSDYGGEFGGAAAGYGAGSRMSQRQSICSGSGHGHDSFQNQPLPTHRLSGMNYLQQPTATDRNVYGGDFHGSQGERTEQLLARANSGSLASDHSDSARTAATTGSSVAYPMPSSKRLMANLNEAPPVPRPALETIQGGRSYTTTTSGGESSLFSSQSPSTAASSTSGLSGEIKKIQELKGRPSFPRANSDDSLLIPSQFLGARVINKDVSPGDEKAGLDWSGKSGLSRAVS